MMHRNEHCCTTSVQNLLSCKHNLLVIEASHLSHILNITFYINTLGTGNSQHIEACAIGILLAFYNNKRQIPLNQHQMRQNYDHF